MFRKIFWWGMFVAAMLVLLCYYFGAADGNFAITVNGEASHPLQGAAFATGGLLVAGLAVVGVLILAVLALVGASMVLLGVFALLFLGLLVVFSPVWVPVAGMAIVIAFVFRKRKGRSPANGRCW